MNPFEPVNNFGRVLEMRSEKFENGNLNPVEVYMIWGLEKQDMSECEWGEPECDGETRYDEQFSLNEAQSQLAIYVSRKLPTILSFPLCNTCTFYCDVHCLYFAFLEFVQKTAKPSSLHHR